MKQSIISVLILIIFFPASLGESEQLLKWEDYNQENPYVFLDNVKNITLNDDWSVDETHHYRIKIQKDSAKNLGEQEIYYNKSREEIIEIKAHVETPGGKIYPYTRIQDLAVYQGSPLYSDMRVKVVTLPQVNKGSIINVTIISKTWHGIIRDQFSRQEHYPAQAHKHYKATYTFPQDKSIQFKQYKAVAPPKRITDKEANIVSFIFEYNETVALPESAIYLPPYAELFGVSSFSSMTSWQMIVDWYRNLVNKNIVDNADITKITKEMTAGKKNQEEKAKAILEFLQDHFRYVSMSFGDNTVEPHPTDEIFNNRYGDCKDWSTLAKQMLSIAGIHSDVVLFNDEFAGNPQWVLPSASAFDHAIIQLEIDGKKYFVDPQLENFDLDQYPQAYNKAYLLIISDDNYQFADIPLPRKRDVTSSFKVIAQIDKTGSTVYDVKAKFDIESSNSLRAVWESLQSDGKDQIFDVIESKFAKGGRLINPKFIGIDQRYGPIVLQCKINSPYAYQVVNDMMILNDQVYQYFPNPFIERERSYPLYVHDSQYSQILGIYKIPSGFKVDYLPDDYVLKHDLMELGRKYKYKDGQIYVRFDFRLKRGRLSNERYKGLLKVWEEYYKKNGQYVILKKSK